MDSDDLNHQTVGAPWPGPGATATPGTMAPGDEAPAGTEGTGEDLCPECGGSGRADGGECSHCAGPGKVIKGISGA
jgi:hypothetical protein